MEFQFTPDEKKFRGEVLKFIGSVLPPDWDEGEGEGYNSPEDIARTKAIVKKLAASGWLTMAWPTAYGGMGAPFMRQTIFQEEAAYRSLPTDAGVGAVSWVAPVLMMRGSEEQKKEHVPPIARGERFWCTLYSEPGAGSDLASLKTAAVRDGDDFVVNGSKIWTSGGHAADWGWLAARTDPSAPKHKGISMLLVDMKTPGITIRPIINMAGIHSFNQVFFDNVRVPRRNLVGQENQGWYTLATALDFERSGVGRISGSRRTFEQMVECLKETKANGAGASRSPVLLSRLAEMEIDLRVGRWLAYRVAWMQGRGLSCNAEASMAKAFGTEATKRLYALGMSMLGLYGQLEHGSRWAVLRGKIARGYLSSVSATIGAGTSEIQRNIIAMRGLGLPRG